MEEKISVWLVGNTGLRSPNRIQEGLKVFAQSPFVGNLHGRENEVGFMNLLNEKGIIQNSEGKDVSGSHARKWRLMFAKNGFIYPQMKKIDGVSQEDLGPLDELTPFGKTFLKADTVSSIQECYLRAMSVEQFEVPSTDGFFSPLRWILAIMLELEKRTGSSELKRIEFALWGHTTNPSYDINEVVNNILDLRQRRDSAPSKRIFDKKEIVERGKHYDKKASNFLDYCDMNMRYLRITGILQRRGRGLAIVPTKHVLAEKLAKSTISYVSYIEEMRKLCTGAPLPTDEAYTALMILDDLKQQVKEKGITVDIESYSLDSPAEINVARLHLEDIIAKTDEVLYAREQRDKWKEISEYMSLLIKGGGTKEFSDDYVIEVPKDETSIYLEWTLWRAALAINHLVNKPYEVRGFKLDSDFMPISTAAGGRGDLYCEFEDCTILTEVTMSSSSRQEAMEGEPVRRHVADAVEKYNKPVYGMFIAIRIDTNTAETFRHGVWYSKGDIKQRLNIVPFTLKQFKTYFDSLFEANQATPDRLVELMNNCIRKRDDLEAPGWKEYIDNCVANSSQQMYMVN